VYLVTGGGGFIGSHLVRALVRRGSRVRVLDNGFSGGPYRVADVFSDVEWIDGDVREMATVRRACAGVEVVFHHAAVASVPRSVARPRSTHAVNVTGTLNVLTAARDAGVRRVIFASSSAVYGNLPDMPRRETMPVQPLSPYGVQKLAAEFYCRAWPSLYGLQTVALRYFNVFGPDQDPNSPYAAVIPRFITAVLSGQSPLIYGDGEQSRDFIPVQNVVDINLLAASVSEASGTVLNVGMGARVTLNQLLGELERLVGRPVRAKYTAARLGDVRESVADISLLQATLGYTPAISFTEGLAETVRGFHRDAIQPALDGVTTRAQGL
jgi:UDP-glucose 4-epimerase